MNNLELWLPVKPYTLNQPFGTNAAYYAKFMDVFGNPEKGHTGIDLQASHGQPVYAPVAGDAFYVGPDVHGGDGIYIRVPDNGTPTYTVILWHLCSKDDPKYKPLIPCDGSTTKVEVGQLIAYADNTGTPFESSGDHLHMGLFPCDKFGGATEAANGYGGCVDPLPFINMRFAEDYMIAEKALEAASKIVMNPSVTPSLLKSIYDFLISLKSLFRLK